MNKSTKGAKDVRHDEDEDGSVKFSVRMPAELVERLDARAKAESRSRSNAVKVLVEAALAQGGAA